MKQILKELLFYTSMPNMNVRYSLYNKMLQHQPKNPQISSDSLDFNPYQNFHQQDQAQLPSQSESSQSQQEYFQKKSTTHKRETPNEQTEQKGRTKAYHQNTYTKLDTKINLHKINNEIGECQQKQLTKQKRTKDKADRATVQQVLDQRTRRILLKLINNQIVTEINGCLSTGKEANVYHAIHEPTKKQYAIKIYKTSILVFKDRDRYVEGEFRFRRGYCSSNPRKMVSMWAQKQLRNLKRMQGVIVSPVGLLVKSNVLVMDFIGKEMKNAPRLKDAQISNVEQWSQIYLQVVKIMRVLYQQCKLIHADLSQYNMLYHENKVWVIDVSQSVEHDHPHALDFLRRDITNVNDFFSKKRVNVFSDWHLFQFIVALGIERGKELEQLEKIMEELEEEAKRQNEGGVSSIEDNVFKRISIPRTLGNISMQKVERQLFGQSKMPNYHKIVTGLQGKAVIREQKGEDQSESSSSSSSSDSESQDEQQPKQGQTASENKEGAVEGANDATAQGRKQGGKQRYEGLSKLQRKHKVKEQKREKRKQKIPKKQKKRLTKKK